MKESAAISSRNESTVEIRKYVVRTIRDGETIEFESDKEQKGIQ